MHVSPSQTLGPVPWERFVTTYSSDYKPLRERRFQVNQLKPRAEAQAAPAFTSPLTDRETWPIFHQCFYKTTNSIYGSSGCSQVSRGDTHSRKFTVTPFIFFTSAPAPFTLPALCLPASLFFPLPCLRDSIWHPPSARFRGVQGCWLRPDRGQDTGSGSRQGDGAFTWRGGERSAALCFWWKG